MTRRCRSSSEVGRKATASPGRGRQSKGKQQTGTADPESVSHLSLLSRDSGVDRRQSGKGPERGGSIRQRWLRKPVTTNTTDTSNTSLFGLNAS